MAAATAPITMREALTLPSIGIDPQFITFTHVTMESDKYICVRETSPQNNIVIIDMNMPNQPWRRPITADSALMNPNSRILALKAQVQGTTQDHLETFDIEMKAKMKSHLMTEQVVFWKWISPKMLGVVTQNAVYHWSIEGESEPVKMFERTANLVNNQIINYRCDPSEKWLILIGIAPGAPERPLLVKGNMQIFSVDQQRSQALEAHAAAFAQFEVLGNENPSTLISFATKMLNAGQITSKVHVIELGAQPGKSSFTKKQADLFFPPDFADDFPVAIQISHKYSLIYVITKLGLLFVYDLPTTAVVYRTRISLDPIFLTTEASTTGGFYAINRQGQVLLATVNEQTIVPFVSGQLNNLELAVSLAKRGNLPGAENLVGQRFQELFAQTKYREAAELAAESPQGFLRTPDTVAKFQNVAVQTGQTPPLLQYFATLLTRGKLNAFESLELSRLVVNQNRKNLLENWLAEDKLECSEELGDLVKTVDNDLALKIYVKARATPNDVAVFSESREFDKILSYSKQVGYTPDYKFPLQTILRTDPQGCARSLWLMEEMFKANGGCGYATKPDFLLKKAREDDIFDPKAQLPVKTTLKVTVCMGEEWYGFRHDHFDAYSLPDFYTKVGIAGVPTDSVMKKTKTLEDNWVPAWKEEFEFPLTVPEIAILRIEVHEYDVSEKDDFGGQACLRVSELQQGIRAVPLYNQNGEKYKLEELQIRLEFD